MMTIGYITKGQKIVLVVGIILAVVVFVYPPFISGGDLVPTVDFALFWQPPAPDPGYGTPFVSTPLLLIEFAALAVVVLMALAIVRPDPDGARKTKAHWELFFWNLCGIPIQIRIKYTDNDQVLEGVLSPTAAGIAEGPAGPIHVLSLEWLEINPMERIPQGKLTVPETADHTSAVMAVLQTLSIPYEWNRDWLHITCHVRKV